MTEWSVQHSRETYNIAHWGGDYIDINPVGHLTVRPQRGRPDAAIDLFALADEIQASGLRPPVLLRFTDILHDRIDALCQAFAAAMEQDAYQGAYSAVYPIKVNQQRSVVEEILSHGGKRVGLEAGSKAELMAVLALSAEKGLVICNGYKDREYIRLALIGKLLGYQVYIVVEKLSELERVMEESRLLNIPPLLGMRMRLASIGQGKWQNTGGEKSKFGLSSAQVLAMVRYLRSAGMLDALRLLHFHLGSQIANIRDIQRGMREAARGYAELHHMGVPIGLIDVGGGLGVDYEGSRSRSFCSINYTLREYAHNVVHTLAEVCAALRLPHPDIVTESGRAMTAHHAVLITDVIDIEQALDIPAVVAPGAADPQVIRDLRSGLETLGQRSAIEAYHDAVHWLAVAQDMYTHGLLTLEQRAQAEQLYFATCRGVFPALGAAPRLHHEILGELNEKLADKYFCNFSIFQSLPDVWAINQIFPIVPLHRLDECPGRRAVIADITCDSDGRIDYYVDRNGIDSTLPLHAVRPGERYLIGIFLVGAYQEILGDMHNLFGDTNAVNVELSPRGGFRLVQAQRGASVAAVLRHVRYDDRALATALRARLEDAAEDGERRRLLLDALENGLSGYTYLEP